MSTIIFDILKLARRLKETGVPEKHVEAEADTLTEVFESHAKDLATKGDLQQAKNEIQANIRWLKWMLVLVIIATLVPVLKSLLT